MLTVFVDVINATNHLNAEEVVYDPGLRERRYVTGVPTRKASVTSCEEALRPLSPPGPRPRDPPAQEGRQRSVHR